MGKPRIEIRPLLLLLVLALPLVLVLVLELVLGPEPAQSEAEWVLPPSLVHVINLDEPDSSSPVLSSQDGGKSSRKLRDLDSRLGCVRWSEAPGG